MAVSASSRNRSAYPTNNGRASSDPACTSWLSSVTVWWMAGTSVTMTWFI